MFALTAYVGKHAAAPPLVLKGAKCEIAVEYTKKKNVIRLTLSDQSEYLFMTHDPVEMNQWQTKIQFHAGMHRLFYTPVSVSAGFIFKLHQMQTVATDVPVACLSVCDAAVPCRSHSTD